MASSDAMREIEEGTTLRLDFEKTAKAAQTGSQVVPVVLQHADTGDVLFIGYANELALTRTLETRTAVLWSTSRNELWHKGATSGDVLDLVDVRTNCEQNSLLYRVRPRGGGVCHTRDAGGQTRHGCYYRVLTPDGKGLTHLD
jgi:phosphoribosyl-AMP cyclohydrolase